MTEKSDELFLEHVLESITAIKEFSRNITLKELETNEMKRDAIIRRIEVIGEAVKNISNKLKEGYPGIEWKKMIGARNIMIHHYFRIDLDAVFNIIKKDIPILEKQILNITQTTK